MTKTFVDRESINDETVIVRKVHVASGSEIAAGTLVLEYETSKTTVECQATESGAILIAVQEGEEIAVGSLLYEIVTRQGEGTSHPARVDSNDGDVSSSGARLSRAALDVARELNIGPDAFAEGTWITSGDVRALARGSQKVEQQTQVGAESTHKELKDGVDRRMGAAAPYMTVPLSLRKRAEIRNVAEVNNHGMVSTIGIELKLRRERLVRPPALFVGSISDIAVFEIARLLRRYPELNGFHVDDRHNAHYEEVNVGVAFDDEANLKVLAIRDADKKTLTEIQREFASLLDLYESGAPISEELLTKATVTISDLSRTEANFVCPLVNGHQSMIVGITRSPAGFALFASFDHRVSEGLRVSRFLGQLRENIVSHYAEHPEYEFIRCDACHRGVTEEISMGQRGLIKIALPGGDEGLLCRSCFEGI